MEHRRPRDLLSKAKDQAESALDRLKKPGPGHPGGDKAVERAKALLAKVKSGPVGATPIGQALQKLLEDLLARGQGLDDFEKELQGRARLELDRRRHIVTALSDAMTLFSDPVVRSDLRSEVIQPARSGSISSAQAWTRVGLIVPTPSPFPFLTWIESKIGPLAIAVGLKGEGGAGLGFTAVEGLTGLRHHCACHFRSLGACVGAVAEVELGIQLAVSPGIPVTGTAVTMEVACGGGWGATGEVSVSLTPIPRKPTLQHPHVFDYEFAGLAVGLGGGGGLDLSISVTCTTSTMLQGMIKGDSEFGGGAGDGGNGGGGGGGGGGNGGNGGGGNTGSWRPPSSRRMPGRFDYYRPCQFPASPLSDARTWASPRS